jgi:hypothetical protein
MSAFFSGTDDNYELGDPGIHLVVGGIKVQERRYEIAASVVGNGRRFILHYDNLVNATPVEGVTFHPKVVDYVDYTSPLVSTYTQYKPSKHSGSTKGKEWNSYQQWLKQYSSYEYSNDTDDPNDPYFYSENYWNYNQGSVSGGRDVKLWEVEDIVNDYITQNQEEMDKLSALKKALEGLLVDVESGLALHRELLRTD